MGVCSAEAPRNRGPSNGIVSDETYMRPVMFAANRRKSRNMHVGVCARALDEQSRRLPVREMNASYPGPICNRQLYFASIGKRNGVIAGMRFFPIMTECESVIIWLRRGAGLEFASPRKNREVTIER